MNFAALSNLVRKKIPLIPKFPKINGGDHIIIKPTISIIGCDILENIKKINKLTNKHMNTSVMDFDYFKKAYNKREDMIYNLVDYNKSTMIAVNRSSCISKIEINKSNANLLNQVNFTQNTSQYKIGNFILKWWNNDSYQMYCEAFRENNNLPHWVSDDRYDSPLQKTL
jgi:hypothetical protein